MVKNKTIETQDSVAGYLLEIDDVKRRTDCSAIIDLITEHTGLEPKMWGTGIVGFGSYHYIYESGHEGDAPLAAISSRKNAITLYLASSIDKNAQLMPKFGKYKAGKGCIYIQKLEDVDKGILVKLVKNTIEHRKKKSTD